MRSVEVGNSAPNLIRPAVREYRSWAMDSRRWEEYHPRDDDIVIATYPKCGTTWLQRIVSMLVFQSPQPRSLLEVSPWIDARFRASREELKAQLDAQTGRRMLKSHLPLDGLPFYENVKYIHAARDGRDVCMSWCNHAASYTSSALADFDRIGLDDPSIRRPYPRVTDPRSFYLDWISGRDVPLWDFFDFENSYWAERSRPNVLLVHYNDLKVDLAAEMRRIADFLDAPVPEHLWPDLVEAAGFGSMQRDGAALLPHATKLWQGGASSFLFRGTNGRWRDVLLPDDVALYEAKAQASFSPGCAEWMAGGRHVAGDPRRLQ